MLIKSLPERLQRLPRVRALAAALIGFALTAGLLSLLVRRRPFAAQPVHVCSHRGASSSGLSPLPTAPELRARVEALLHAGVVCLDLDVSRLPDGSLVVAHPTDVAAAGGRSLLPLDDMLALVGRYRAAVRLLACRANHCAPFLPLLLSVAAA